MRLPHLQHWRGRGTSAAHARGLRILMTVFDGVNALNVPWPGVLRSLGLCGLC